jgi:hypothetical protein
VIKINCVSIKSIIAMVIIRVHKAPTNKDVQVCTDTYLLSDGIVLLVGHTARLESISRFALMKSKRTIRGGIVTTIIVFGLLLIIASVTIALAFVYIRRKNQRRRHFTYSLESTSDDWEPSGTGYHLFDNWTHNRRTTDNQIDHVIIDANEHMPITTSLTNR